MKATSVLSQQDVDFFRTNGYYLNKQQLFSPDKMDRLEEIFDEHLADKGDKLSDELDTPHFRDPRLLEFLLSDEVLDLVEPLVGPDIALVDEPLHLQGPVRRSRHAVARGQRVLERPAQRVRPHRHRLARARPRATGRTAACG